MGNVLSVAAITGAPDATGVSQTGHDGPTTAAGGGGATGAGGNQGVTATDNAIALTQATGEQPPSTEKFSDKNWVPALVGIEGTNGPGWKNWEGPKRIKESILTPEETKKCQEIIARVFHPDTVDGVRIAFHPDDVIFVMRKVRKYLESEPLLIEDIPWPIQVVGDLHGQLYDLARVFDEDAVDGKPGWECSKYLFLGDYVDRGRHSLEIVMALFSLKMLYPDRIFLLRGNHEFVNVNIRYGFAIELDDRYKNQNTSDFLYFLINATFGFLSIAAIVGDTYFCAHGGISPMGFTRRTFRVLTKPITYSNENVIIHDVCWSDPANGLRGTCFNRDRGTSVFFGIDALCFAMDNMQTKMLIRGHSKVQPGFDLMGACLTIFSATDNCETGNDGATCIIDADGKYGIRIFEKDEGRSEVESMLLRIERPWMVDNNLVNEKVPEKAAAPPGKFEDEKTTYEDEKTYEDDRKLTGIRNFAPS